MILIFTRQREPSGYRLAKRLKSLGEEHRLIFEEDVYTQKGNELEIKQHETRIFGEDVRNIKSLFLRKWNANAISNRLPHTPENTHAISEYQFVFDFIGLMPHKQKLGFYNLAMHNKLHQQQMAKMVGLPLLQNIVCNNQMPRLVGHWVSKPLNRSFFNWPAYGNHETVAIPQNIPENFGLAYLQPFIPKQFEIRLMYLDGACYAIAYFTQKNKTPDRRYAVGAQSIVPFSLPMAIQQKIAALMQQLGGNYALIDLLYDEESNNFYFLEANPFGQYGDLIKYGGYDIDGAIINFLTHEKYRINEQSPVAQLNINAYNASATQNRTHENDKQFS